MSNVTLKIIIANGHEVIAEHARKIIRAQDAYDERHPHAETVRPRGVPSHSAKHPITCDDCGVTYWGSNPYIAHVGCRSGRAKMGF